MKFKKLTSKLAILGWESSFSRVFNFENRNLNCILTTRYTYDQSDWEPLGCFGLALCHSTMSDDNQIWKMVKIVSIIKHVWFYLNYFTRHKPISFLSTLHIVTHLILISRTKQLKAQHLREQKATSTLAPLNNSLGSAKHVSIDYLLHLSHNTNDYVAPARSHTQ